MPDISTSVSRSRPTGRLRRKRGWAVGLGFLPLVLVTMVYLFCMGETVWLSFTKSKMIPGNTFAGLTQYALVLGDERWQLSVVNLSIYCGLFVTFSTLLGLAMAVALDANVRFEDTFRTIYLYPLGMSFIVTGLAWQWILNPAYGLQRFFRMHGFPDITMDWIARRETALYVVVLAGVWQASGMVMAILLAGLRGIDADLTKAAQIDGISRWRYFRHIAIPELSPMFALTTVMLALGGIKVYEVVIAMTGGGPGISTTVPTKYVMGFIFSNIGRGSAAATMMLVAVIVFLAPYYHIARMRQAAGTRT